MKSNSKALLNSSGFTLLELLISMAIRVLISYSTYIATLQTFKLRDTLSQEAKFNNSIQLAVNLLRRDLTLLYSPTVLVPPPQINSETLGAPPLGAELQMYMADDTSQIYQFWSAATHPNGLRPSRFVGAEQKLSFISLTYTRIYKNSPGSEFAKISYELKRDEKNPETKGKLMLIRKETPNAFASDQFRDTLETSYELLTGLKVFKLSFLKREGETWKALNAWDSESQDTKYVFPDLIQLDLEVIGAQNLSYIGKYSFRPEIPFNGIPASY